MKSLQAKHYFSQAHERNSAKVENKAKDNKTQTLVVVCSFRIDKCDKCRRLN